MYQYINLCPPFCLCLVHTLCIVWWKPGCPCMAVCLYPSHLISVATHCLECAHASGHIFMSTLLLMLAKPPMDSDMESWVHLCATVFVSHSPWLCSHTLFRMCTCISRWIYVHLTVHTCSIPVYSLMETGCPCMSVCLCPSHLISVPTPCLECVQAPVHAFMSTWLPMSAPPLCTGLMETWVSMYGSMFVS